MPIARSVFKGRSIPSIVTYSTTFPATENPISEGGMWVKNLSNDWAEMRTTGGNAVGTQVDNTFDDSYSILQGDWGVNYELDAVIFRSGSISAANHEVELNVRFKDTATTVRGYEVLLNKDGAIQCFRWVDGLVGDSGRFTEITAESGTAAVGAVADGALFKVRIVGNLITVFYQGSQQCTFNISSIGGTKHDDGKPAIAAFCRPSLEGSNPDHYGFKSLTVNRL
jgi:hypothetical protein